MVEELAAALGGREAIGHGFPHGNRGGRQEEGRTVAKNSMMARRPPNPVAVTRRPPEPLRPVPALRAGTSLLSVKARRRRYADGLPGYEF